MTDVDVLPSDTSWLSEPTTGVHQFGGGSDFLVKKLADVMLACVTAIGGVIAGQKIESRKHRQRD
jgi:hypothetical protein